MLKKSNSDPFFSSDYRKPPRKKILVLPHGVSLLWLGMGRSMGPPSGPHHPQNGSMLSLESLVSGVRVSKAFRISDPENSVLTVPAENLRFPAPMSGVDIDRRQWENAIAGAFAGFATVASLHPLDVVRTRFQGPFPKTPSFLALSASLSIFAWKVLMLICCSIGS